MLTHIISLKHHSARHKAYTVGAKLKFALLFFPHGHSTVRPIFKIRCEIFTTKAQMYCCIFPKCCSSCGMDQPIVAKPRPTHLQHLEPTYCWEIFFSFLDIFDIELGVTVRDENGVGLPRISEQKFYSRVRCSMELSILLNIHCLFWM